MRKIIVSEMVTPDGYFAGPNGELDWFFWNDEMAKNATDLISTVDTILFGRATYELMNMGLIDEYHHLVNPVVLGIGKPLFKNIKDRHNLKLVKAKAFTNGVVFLDYRTDRKA